MYFTQLPEDVQAHYVVRNEVYCKMIYPQYFEGSEGLIRVADFVLRDIITMEKIEKIIDDGGYDLKEKVKFRQKIYDNFMATYNGAGLSSITFSNIANQLKEAQEELANFNKNRDSVLKELEELIAFFK